MPLKLKLCNSNIKNSEHASSVVLTSLEAANIQFMPDILHNYNCYIVCLYYFVLRTRRVAQTFTKIGPAVLNGGMSTLLAFILLSTSESYVCLSFFKIFFLICVFGLYHGLIALPVILAVAGPLPQVGTMILTNLLPSCVQVVEVCPEEVDEYALYSRYSVPEPKKQSKVRTRSVSICREAVPEEEEEKK